MSLSNGDLTVTFAVHLVMPFSFSAKQVYKPESVSLMPIKNKLKQQH